MKDDVSARKIDATEMKAKTIHLLTAFRGKC